MYFGLNILEHLRKISTKIAFILITTLILACNAEKEFLMENNSS
jgi:hypothetical protein